MVIDTLLALAICALIIWRYSDKSIFDKKILLLEDELWKIKNPPNKIGAKIKHPEYGVLVVLSEKFRRESMFLSNVILRGWETEYYQESKKRKITL